MLAKTYFQPPEKVAECPGLFVSKLTPTGPTNQPKYESVHDPVGVELAREDLLSAARKSG